MTAGKRVNDTLITITKPEEQELIPKPGDPEPRSLFLGAYLRATAGNR